MCALEISCEIMLRSKAKVEKQEDEEAGMFHSTKLLLLHPHHRMMYECMYENHRLLRWSVES